MDNWKKVDAILLHDYPEYTEDIDDFIQDLRTEIKVDFDSDEIIDSVHEKYWEVIKPIDSLCVIKRGQLHRKFFDKSQKFIEKQLIRAWIQEIYEQKEKLYNLDRAELADTYQEIVLGKKPVRSGPEYADQATYNQSFMEMAWLEFDFDAVIEVLLDERKTFKYHRTILFEALAGWVVAPSDTNVRKNAIKLIARYAIATNEKKVIAAGHERGFVAADAAARVVHLGEGFFEQVYYPIGGMMAFSTLTEPNEYAASLRKNHGPSITTLVKLLEIVHFHNETRVKTH